MKWFYGLFYLSMFAILFNMCNDGGIKTVHYSDGESVVKSGTLQDQYCGVHFREYKGKKYSFYTTEKVNPEYAQRLEYGDLLDSIIIEANEFSPNDELKYINKELKNNGIAIHVVSYK